VGILTPPVRDRSIGLALRNYALAGKQRNPIDLPADAALATITTSTTADAALSQQIRVNTTTGAASFAYYGGLPVIQSSFYRFKSVTQPVGVSGSVTVNGQTNYNANAWAFEFDFDGTTVDLMVQQSSIQFRVLVNGQYVSKTGTSYAAGSGVGYVRIAFASRAIRRIRFESEQAAGLYGANIGPTERLWKPQKPPFPVAALGDSYSRGVGATVGGAGWASVLGHLLGGLDVWQIALSGTGYITPGIYHIIGDHLDDLLDANFKMVIFCFGINDRNGDQTAIATAALSAWRGARSRCSTAPILVTGCHAGNSGPNSATTTTEATLLATFNTWADSNSFFVPISASPSWIFGTGKVGTTNSSGNSDIYVSADGTHPPDAGHEYIARRCEAVIRDQVIPTLS
jgi:lysophospholipase L1-like esterase